MCLTVTLNGVRMKGRIPSIRIHTVVVGWDSYAVYFSYRIRRDANARPRASSGLGWARLPMASPPSDRRARPGPARPAPDRESLPGAWWSGPAHAPFSRIRASVMLDGTAHSIRTDPSDADGFWERAMDGALPAPYSEFPPPGAF